MSDPRRTDVAIIGDGVIGLSTALELARAGAQVCLIGVREAGAASSAAAGLLAPAFGHLESEVRPFFEASLDLYPSFIDSLRQFDGSLTMLRGLIEVVGESGPRPDGSSSQPLTSEDLARLEPALSAPMGGLLHTRDGAIDNVRLVLALRLAVAGQQSIRQVTGTPAKGVATSAQVARVTLADDTRIEAAHIVIAAGAWSPRIRGLPRSLPVSPLKGQMLALGATSLSHPVMADDVYLVPRESEIAVGATTEHAGFDTVTTPDAIAALRAAAVKVCPTLATAPVLRAWAGIRPATPDMLPIIGRDLDVRWLLYACGHSKNGILLAPGTARAIVALVQEKRPEWDLAPFSISRFGADE